MAQPLQHRPQASHGAAGQMRPHHATRLLDGSTLFCSQGSIRCGWSLEVKLYVYMLSCCGMYLVCRQLHCCHVRVVLTCIRSCMYDVSSQR
jgi:hypothetical protein